MLVLVGQDVLWTAGIDYAVPWGAGATAGLATSRIEAVAVAKKATDFVTSMSSVVYDWDRALGRRTSINAGVSIYGQGFVLYYPSPDVKSTE
jgi:hypothetical protein